jgi:hypothetical protein
MPSLKNTWRRCDSTVRGLRKSGADLGFREAIAGEPGDLPLLSGQVVARLDAAPADPLPGRRELIVCAVRERLHADRREHVGEGLMARPQGPRADRGGNWECKPPGFADEATIEEWVLPIKSDFLERSIRVDPDEAMKRATPSGPCLVSTSSTPTVILRRTLAGA